MNIADLLTPDRIQVRTDLRSKKRVLEEIAKLLASGTDEVPEDQAFSSLVKREKLGTTGLGSGVAIPHGRLRGLAEATGALISLQPGINYETPDGESVDLVFGLLVPQDATEEHLQILRGLAEMFVDEDFCASMRAAKDNNTLHELLKGYPSGT